MLMLLNIIRKTDAAAYREAHTLSANRFNQQCSIPEAQTNRSQHSPAMSQTL